MTWSGGMDANHAYFKSTVPLCSQDGDPSRDLHQCGGSNVLLIPAASPSRERLNQNPNRIISLENHKSVCVLLIPKFE